MALTPIPYTDNWKDTFGSQFAAPDLTVKVEAPTVLPTDLVEPEIKLTVSGAPGGVLIDWGDETVTPSAGGLVTHLYKRNGAYRIRTTPVGYPDLFVDTLVRVSNIQPPSSEKVFSVTMTELVAAFTVANGIMPFDVDFGDGNIAREFNINFSHTYAAGTYTASIRDVSGWRATVQVVASDATVVSSDEGEPDANPWDCMTRHAEIDEFATDLDTPDDWTTMTIAAKKEWLDENYVPEE